MTSISTLPTIKFLKQPTSQAWVDQAIAHLEIILLDHSHCERKAAGVALNLMFRYPAHTKLVRQLTAINSKQLSADDALREYKAQQGVERGFRFLKNPMFFASSVFSSPLSGLLLWV